jgi:hypothetical protein
MPDNRIDGGTWQSLGDFQAAPHDVRVPTPDTIAQRLGSQSWAEYQARATADGKAVYEAATAGVTLPTPEPTPEPEPPVVALNRLCRLFWYVSFANSSFLPEYGGVFAPIIAKGWNLSLRDGWWPGHSAHHTVDSLLARHPFIFVDRPFGVFAQADEYVVGYGEDGLPGMCGVRGPRQADPAVLTGWVTAWRLRNRRIKERGGESLCYIGCPPHQATTYTATAADNWFKEARQAEFDGIGLDVGGPLVPPSPAHVVTNRCGNYGMKCWLEPTDRTAHGKTRMQHLRHPFICTETWAADSTRAERHVPSTMVQECMVILDAQSGTGDALVAKALAWRDRGWSVALEPSSLTPAQLDAAVAGFTVAQ